MDDCELVALITAVSCAIAKCASDDEINLLSVVFTQLGDTLGTILTNREIRENRLNRIEAKKEDTKEIGAKQNAAKVEEEKVEGVTEETANEEETKDKEINAKEEEDKWQIPAAPY